MNAVLRMPHADPLGSPIDISPAADIAGFVGACVVDIETGLMIASQGGGSIDLDLAASGNAQIVRSNRQTARALGLDDTLEDAVFTMGGQYHLIRVLDNAPDFFVLLLLNRTKANLGMARLKLKVIAEGLMR